MGFFPLFEEVQNEFDIDGPIESESMWNCQFFRSITDGDAIFALETTKV